MNMNKTLKPVTQKLITLRYKKDNVSANKNNYHLLHTSWPHHGKPQWPMDKCKRL